MKTLWQTNGFNTIQLLYFNTFTEIFHVLAKMFSKLSVADLLYVGKAYNHFPHNKSAADEFQIASE